VKLDLVGIVVADMARALTFYRALGVPFPDGSESEDHVEAVLPSGLRLALDTEETVRSFQPGWQAPSGSPRMGLAFLCDSPADVDAAWERLTGMGFHGETAPFDAFWGQRYAILHDPDGNGVDLFAALPSSPDHG
jgi:catechol 2,3-dioxygenase-like lactoylglutathione lyase family enzyme